MDAAVPKMPGATPEFQAMGVLGFVLRRICNQTWVMGNTNQHNTCCNGLYACIHITSFVDLISLTLCFSLASYPSLDGIHCAAYPEFDANIFISWLVILLFRWLKQS